jgi:hypothetical protein
MTQVAEKPPASSIAPIVPSKSDEPVLWNPGGILAIAFGLVLLIGVALVGGWILNTPPHSYEPSLLGVAWSMSLPLGVVLVMLGVAALMRGEGRLIGLIAVTGVLVLGWTIWRDVLNWSDAQPPALLFGAGGVLMILFFLGAAWHWARRRSQRTGPARAVADLRLFGLAFLLLGAWEICGLLGSPIYLLRPALAATSPLAFYAVPVAASVLVYLTIGFALMFLAEHVEARISKTSG